MADVLNIKPTVSQTFTGTGSEANYILEHIPNEIKMVTVNGIEVSNESYSNNEYTFTINAAIDAEIIITYNYWTGIPTVKGDDGMSAYEYALKGGYKGSEEQFYSDVASVANKQSAINSTGMLKGNGNGSVVTATAGADYVIPTGNVATATALETARKIQVNLNSTSAAEFNGSNDANPGVTGVLSPANGGTGNNSVDTSPVSGSTKMVTSGGIYNALSGKADSSHTQSANTISAGTLGGAVLANANAISDLNNPQIRNIYAGTVDMNAGSTALPTGSIYIFYET